MATITPEQLRELGKRIIASGVLGRSKTYGAILDYLIECSIEGEQPKEVAIAVDVLGRDSDFDVGKDSIVRVHLYHLRNKLQGYFEKHGSQEDWVLEIPKGQYLLVAVPRSEQSVDETSLVTPELASENRSYLWPGVAGVLALLLIVSLFMPPLVAPDPLPTEGVRQMQPWKGIMDDQSPVLVVVGDYFIFGELDSRGNVRRMVREFNVNSAADLDAWLMMQPELYDVYYNLGLTYLPVGSASALASVMPLLHDLGDRVSVRAMSELSSSDLTGNHIIYIGYISGLGILEDFMFDASALHLGKTYDELVNADGKEYITNSGIQNTQTDFRDYGMVSAFSSPRGHQFVLIAGMRDAALISIAEELSSSEGLEQISEAVGQEDAWEGLYEVYGYDHTSFNARLIEASSLNTRLIWGGE